MMPTVVLGPLTHEEQAAFVDEQVADHAAWLANREPGPDLPSVLALARDEIEAEIGAALQAGDAFWAARTADGTTVGWLWVKHPVDGLSPHTAFLQQITVKPEARRQGYATAMLAALECTLAQAGHRELRLNVWDTNQPGRRLYERAGYELAERLPGKCQLRKVLTSGATT